MVLNSENGVAGIQGDLAGWFFLKMLKKILQPFDIVWRYVIPESHWTETFWLSLTNCSPSLYHSLKRIIYSKDKIYSQILAFKFILHFLADRKVEQETAIAHCSRKCKNRVFYFKGKDYLTVGVVAQWADLLFEKDIPYGVIGRVTSWCVFCNWFFDPMWETYM